MLRNILAMKTNTISYFRRRIIKHVITSRHVLTMNNTHRDFMSEIYFFFLMCVSDSRLYVGFVGEIKRHTF